MIKTVMMMFPLLRVRAREREKGVFHMVGYRSCRACGEEWNCADLVAGLCPACARVRAHRLADLQREYQAAVDAGEAGASARVADLIREYQRSEGVRLQAVPAAYRVR